MNKLHDWVSRKSRGWTIEIDPILYYWIDFDRSNLGALTTPHRVIYSCTLPKHRRINVSVHYGTARTSTSCACSYSSSS